MQFSPQRLRVQSRLFSNVVNDEGFLPNADPKLMWAKTNSDLFPIDVNNASFFEMVQIPRVGPLTAKRIMRARQCHNIRFSSDLEPVIGANLTRKISPFIDLKDRRLTDFKGK